MSAVKSSVRPTALLVLLLGAPGCASNPYVYGPLGAVVAQPRPDSCEVALLFAPPDRAYDSLGVLAPADIEHPKLAREEGRFRSAVLDQVCAAGGDAVVIERDGEGRYLRATVIKLR
jgi:hypothetical protein